MTLPHLSVTQGTGRQHGPKVSHQFISPFDGYPNDAKKDVCTCQKNHGSQEQARHPDEYVVQALDYLLPAVGAKKFGASKYGFWGAIIGMLLGIIFVPPLGIIIGAFLGAISGELIAGKEASKALKAGWGVFVGVMVGMLLKLILAGVMTFYFIKALF